MNIKSTYENDKQKNFNEEQNNYSNEKLQTQKESIPINSTGDGVQQQNNQKQHHDYRKLDELSEGEFANTIRFYTNAPYFDFTSRTQKINNTEDVAYLFKNLQEEAIEHSFAVFVDYKNNYKVQWLGMGTPVGTVVDINAMIFGALHFENIKKVYFVHNHPSGRLIASKQDVDALSKIKKSLNNFNINVQGIIINLNSGHYAIFDDSNTVEVKKGFHEKANNEYKAEILTFSKQSFLHPPSTLTAIRTHQDAATFLSQMRFGAALKGGYLLLNNSNNINANFFYNYTNTTSLAREIFLNAGRYAARAVILYGNDKQYNETLAKNFQSIIKHSDISLLDVISISEPSHIVATTLAELINENKDIELKSMLLEETAPFSKEIENNSINKKYITVKEAHDFLCEIHNSYNYQQQTQDIINLFIKSQNLKTMANEQTLQTNAPQVKNSNLEYLENQILFTGFKLSPGEKKELEKKISEKVDTPVFDNNFRRYFQVIDFMIITKNH